MANTYSDRWGRPGWSGSSNSNQGPSQDGASAWGPNWGPPPWGSSYGAMRRGWHPLHILFVVTGFIIWWPIGLAFLFYTLWSRKMGCWSRDDRWQERFDRKMEKFDYKMQRFRERMGAGGFGGAPSSGNHAFDEYRMETLKRLEDEQREFKDFLDRLRHAKDKQEFDSFMSERKSRPPAPTNDQPQA